MPVRIYDIARRLGIENKVVLAKAKDLGITGARVPSSSLDKITAEYLEDQLAGSKPPPDKEKPKATEPKPIVIVKGPEESQESEDAEVTTEEKPAAPKKAKKTATTKAAKKKTSKTVEPETVEAPKEPDAEVAKPVAEPEPQPEPEPVAAEAPVKPEPEPEPETPPPPPPPPAPALGSKVGFIQLPSRPAARRGKQAAGRPEPQRGGRLGARDGRSGGPRDKKPESAALPPRKEIVLPDDAKTITIKPPIIVRNLAENLNRKPYQLIADLIELKVMAGVNQAIDEDTARLLCAKYGFRFEVEKRERGGGIVHSHTKLIKLEEVEDKPEDLVARPPVVTIMGHVDHGKTTLLDVIRKSNVVAGEAGGITQHIGAYTIQVPNPDGKGDPQQITFLDTPGHAAFTAMRARGANVTDIVILVVAADDGLKPQTLEAIDHAKAAEVPILVAVNKIDHPNADPLKVRQQLQEKGMASDEWGGDTIFCDVSALKKQGIDKLLEMVLLQAELLELKANPKRPAKGNVIESGVAAGGPTASVLVRMGTLKVGQTILCGEHWGRVRALINEEGKRLKEAGPSVAVKVLGLNGVPEAGSEFNVVADEKSARTIMEERVEAARKSRLEGAGTAKEDILAQLAKSQLKELKVLVKGDTQGSVEAIVDSLSKITSEKVNLKIIHSAVGIITETDVHLASASEALILGFHTRLDNGVSDLAKHHGVQVKLYSIIYELVDEVKLAMAGMLEPELKEQVIGAAAVRKVFELSKGGNVAGCIVDSGRITRGKVRVLRRKNRVYEGAIQSLRRFQDEVNEVRSGMECGIRIDGFHDFEPGDIIECFTTEKVAAKL